MSGSPRLFWPSLYESHSGDSLLWREGTLDYNPFLGKGGTREQTDAGDRFDRPLIGKTLGDQNNESADRKTDRRAGVRTGRCY